MIVVDASVSVKWFINEVGSDKATSLLQGLKKLIAPQIIRIEVSSALLRLYRMNILLHPDAVALLQEWHEALQSQVITLEDNATDIKVAESIALEHRHTLPDCIYIAVALRLQIPLVTADMVQAEKAKLVGVNVITL
ncbi:type II toxin-antitoxin system VapC family toxin [uncultured Nostoc sp.]|uniref:type II toxin-antitoxin system VapC family toxin n=1 Tax=uncultured Nostoc sp. TaxID=340711 RepID=UPI0035CC1FF0